MTADDTSREALVESLRGPLANVLCNASNFPRRAQPHILGADMGPLMDATVEAVADAVVMPLAQERDAAIKRAEAAESENERLRILWDTSGKNDLIEQRDTYRERWRQLMRDHEAVVKERDELEAENERLRDTARNYEIAMHAARGERDEAIERAATESGGSTACTCPSGDGSLRWPCPQHPPTTEPGGSDLDRFS